MRLQENRRVHIVSEIRRTPLLWLIIPRRMDPPLGAPLWGSRRVCVLLQDLLQSCVRGGRRIVEDMEMHTYHLRLRRMRVAGNTL
jgi:hypothetical protein